MGICDDIEDDVSFVFVADDSGFRAWFAAESAVVVKVEERSAAGSLNASNKSPLHSIVSGFICNPGERGGCKGGFKLVENGLEFKSKSGDDSAFRRSFEELSACI